MPTKMTAHNPRVSPARMAKVVQATTKAAIPGSSASPPPATWRPAGMRSRRARAGAVALAHPRPPGLPPSLLPRLPRPAGLPRNGLLTLAWVTPQTRRRMLRRASSGATRRSPRLRLAAVSSAARSRTAPLCRTVPKSPPGSSRRCRSGSSWASSPAGPSTWPRGASLGCSCASGATSACKGARHRPRAIRSSSASSLPSSRK